MLRSDSGPSSRARGYMTLASSLFMPPLSPSHGVDFRHKSCTHTTLSVRGVSFHPTLTTPSPLSPKSSSGSSHSWRVVFSHRVAMRARTKGELSALGCKS